ncbi:MAG: hypothetical protein Fur0037_27260 [Planctomycetota bacterium]
MLGILALAGISLMAFWLAKPDSVGKPEAPPAPRAPAAARPLAPAALPIDDPVSGPPKPRPQGPVVRYPDGSTMPALNGVRQDVVLQWGTRPFTPVIGTQTDGKGLVWYVHQDGTLSTVWNGEVNGVPQAQGMVAQPHEIGKLRQDAGKAAGK